MPKSLAVLFLSSLLLGCSFVEEPKDYRCLEDENIQILSDIIQSKQLDLDAIVDTSSINKLDPGCKSTLLQHSLLNSDQYSLNDIENILRLGADPNFPVNEHYLPPIFLSTKENGRKYTDLLIRYGASPDLSSLDRREPTAIFSAVRYWNHKALLSLLEAGANPNTRNSVNETAIVYKISGNWQATSILLDYGADYNVAIFGTDKTFLWFVQNTPHHHYWFMGVDWRKKVINELERQGVKFE